MNVGTMNGRANEIFEMCERRNVDICCLQETRWKGPGSQWIVGKNERYRFFWQGDKNERAIGGVGVLVAEKLESSVIEINREMVN